jgi:hypothetical protein
MVAFLWEYNVAEVRLCGEGVGYVEGLAVPIAPAKAESKVEPEEAQQCRCGSNPGAATLAE